MSIWAFLKAAPHREEIHNSKAVNGQYKYWRWRIFTSMYIGYVFFYFSRQSFTFAMPSLMQDLHFTKADLGILISVLSLMYGVSKFLSGMLSDRSNPRYLMSLGLILTGVFCIFFGLSSSTWLFAIFLGLNGWFQGWGWPPCAKLLTHWYSQNERGRWWGMWNTSHSVGGFLIPFISAFCAQQWGWRYAMYIPGLMCIGVGFFLMSRLRDTPQSLGLPTVEKYRNDYPSGKKVEDRRELSAFQIFFDYVFSNPYIWLLSVSYFFVYLVRASVNHWSMMYLVEEKGASWISAGASVGLFEIGGIFGSLAAGWASDRLFQGKRNPVIILFSSLVALVVIALWYAPVSNMVLNSTILFMIGFLIFGPQMLVGMAAAELSHKKAAGTASGFTGLIAHLGAACAGYPMGKLAETYGWSAFFIVLCVSAIFSAFILVPIWSKKAAPDRLLRTFEDKDQSPTKT